MWGCFSCSSLAQQISFNFWLNDLGQKSGLRMEIASGLAYAEFFCKMMLFFFTEIQQCLKLLQILLDLICKKSYTLVTSVSVKINSISLELPTLVLQNDLDFIRQSWRSVIEGCSSLQVDTTVLGLQLWPAAKKSVKQFSKRVVIFYVPTFSVGTAAHWVSFTHLFYLLEMWLSSHASDNKFNTKNVKNFFTDC